MKTISKLIGTLCAAGILAVGSAQANSITGSITMSGITTLNGPLGSATSASFANPAATVLATGTGSYVGTGGASVDFTDFGWSPATTPVTPLWSFDVGLWDYSFDLSTIHVMTQNSTFLNLVGNGTANITGVGSPYSPTSGTWSFTITQQGGTAVFGFISSNTSVPDGGTTMSLLGLTLVGVEALRRKLFRN